MQQGIFFLPRKSNWIPVKVTPEIFFELSISQRYVQKLERNWNQLVSKLTVFLNL